MDEMGYRHGDRVRDTRTGAAGTVRVSDLTPEEIAEGFAAGEVQWDGLFVVDELDVAISNGLIKEGGSR